MIDIEDREICIVGNSQSILEREHPEIDNYDVVIRCNWGYPQEEQKRFTGNKTDLVAISTPEPGLFNMYQKDMAYIVMTDKHHKFFSKYDIEFFDREERNNLVKKLGGKTRPSTGIMIFEYVLNRSPKSINLYGFDFFVTKNRIKKTTCSKNHNMEAERQYITKMLEGRGKIY